jgi:hypothetical protein
MKYFTYTSLILIKKKLHDLAIIKLLMRKVVANEKKQ